ncbi:hypothetical protein Y032_0049g1765 [Ancylostoma ceylanicum]|nr:hypothetical protein Y032_0049g1765 [Ancylostoma ceylanicum]
MHRPAPNTACKCYLPAYRWQRLKASEARFGLQVSSIAASLRLFDVKSRHSTEPSPLIFLELDGPGASATTRFKCM